MTVKPLTKHPLEFLSLKGCCTGSSESTLLQISHCWKSHVMAHITQPHGSQQAFMLGKGLHVSLD